MKAVYHNKVLDKYYDVEVYEWTGNYDCLPHELVKSDAVREIGTFDGHRSKMLKIHAGGVQMVQKGEYIMVHPNGWLKKLTKKEFEDKCTAVGV